MTETPTFTVIKKQGDIELRDYSPYIKAEVDVTDTSYRNAIFQGFRILADFIFGNNIKSQKIAMTSPVQVEESEKIAMTSPVTISGEDSYTVAFIMPSEYTLETLPQPKNPAISFIKVEARTLASMKFSGFYRENQAEKAKGKLQHWVEMQGYEADGDFIIASYDPPWVPWFLARNEVMVPIKQDSVNVE
jgi:hypothetical protein